MSGSISKICVSFWKWNYILHGEFNCSCDLAYKACRISNKSHYLKRQGRVKKALKKFWRCDRYNLGTARRVWALGLGGVFSSPSSHRAAHKLITLGKLLNLSGLGLYKYKTQIIKRTYNTLSKLGYFGSSDGNESACNAGDLGLIPAVGKIPWRREQLPTPVFWPGEFHGQRSLVGYSPWSHKELDTAERLSLSLYHLDGTRACSGSWHFWEAHRWSPDSLSVTSVLLLFPTIN